MIAAVLLVATVQLFSAITLSDALVTYGPLGIGVAALGIFAARAYDREVKRADKAETKLDVMIQDWFTKVLPVLSRTTEVLKERAGIDREIIETMKDAADAIRQRERDEWERSRRRGP